MDKKLGKIERIYFGLGGYQNCELGIFLILSGKGWTTDTGKSAWDQESISCDEHTKWTEDDRSKWYAEIMRHISSLLKVAKVDDISGLVGKPIEATFDGNILKEWRLFDEVL